MILHLVSIAKRVEPLHCASNIVLYPAKAYTEANYGQSCDEKPRKKKKNMLSSGDDSRL